MLYCVMMDVEIPVDMDPVKVASLREAERLRAIELQEQGIFVHLWRVSGRMSNVSIFDCESNEQLHDVLMSLPLFPFLKTKVIPLSKHPSSIK